MLFSQKTGAAVHCARYSPRSRNIAAQFTPPVRSRPRILESSRDGSRPPKLAGLDPGEAFGPVERGLLLLEARAASAFAVWASRARVVGVLKVLLLDVRRPKLGKLKGIFFFVLCSWLRQCYPVLGVDMRPLLAGRSSLWFPSLAGSAREG